jgi:polysaccharide biosynthesis PFTS motif protein
MKSPNGNFIANEIFSNEIQNLLRKKIFAKSKYFYSTKNPPKDPTKIIPTGAYSKVSVIKNYIVCILLLIVYFINIFRLKSKDSGKNLILIYSLSKEQSVIDGSIKSLYTFLESKGLASDPDSVVLIEIRKILRSKKCGRARTTLDIPLRIYINNFSPTLKVICWFSMCKRFCRIMQQHRKNSQLSMVFKEFVFDQIVYSAMDPDKTDKLITTQSNIAYQPLIFEYENFAAKKFMIWYSSNSVPIKYKKEKLKRFTINPTVYINMRIDEHWVWTKEHKNYLSKYSQAKILLKQSLMFYTATNLKTSNKKIDVLVFDVTPVNNIKITRNSIYTTSESINFINEVIACVKMLNQAYKKDYRVQLKHKRIISKNHSSDYSKFIDQKVKNFEIDVIEPHQNLYDLISNSRLVIGFPFTSPVVIGQELNRPSIFYCSSKLLPTDHKGRNLSFIQSQTSLYSYMEKVLIKST